MLTSPLVRLPYSAEGIPRITSTLSMSSVDMARMSTPLLVMLRLPSADDDEVEDCVPPKGEYWRLASVISGTPSMTNWVPSEVME